MKIQTNSSLCKTKNGMISGQTVIQSYGNTVIRPTSHVPRPSTLILRLHIIQRASCFEPFNLQVTIALVDFNFVR